CTREALARLGRAPLTPLRASKRSLSRAELEVRVRVMQTIGSSACGALAFMMLLSALAGGQAVPRAAKSALAKSVRQGSPIQVLSRAFVHGHGLFYIGKTRLKAPSRRRTVEQEGRRTWKT